MRRSLLFTFIADDKPGIVDQLSRVVAENSGNWLQSRLSKLSGKFSGVVNISISDEHIAELKAGLEALHEQGILTLVDSANSAVEAAPENYHSIAILGLDRPGIVREIAQALAEKHINVINMESSIESAPMTGEPLFKSDLDVEIPESVHIDEIFDTLDAICTRLDIDWNLKKH